MRGSGREEWWDQEEEEEDPVIPKLKDYKKNKAKKLKEEYMNQKVIETREKIAKKIEKSGDPTQSEGLVYRQEQEALVTAKHTFLPSPWLQDTRERKDRPPDENPFFLHRSRVYISAPKREYDYDVQCYPPWEYLFDFPSYKADFSRSSVCASDDISALQHVCRAGMAYSAHASDSEDSDEWTDTEY